ncbi:Endonuclease V [Cryptosporangium aurantiacum]|uniref:Endonuclease V n=1 Tax=Cryptosporangium aurantiacum TaxID=134849 RepID=A0A1M7QRB1_9ACTN|nr:endonuclease V [Cryptosporangium aurantiacum]SHN33814.1 Endonuclease V [Cryptosporangium aurantiacum]
MRVDLPPDWPTTEAAAIAAQETLRARVDATGTVDARLIAGLDVAYDTGSDLIAGAAVVVSAATLATVAEATVVSRVTFPYVPGLLAFREIPVLLAALADLPVTPDLLVCDGYGLAHPRRFGLACHLGVLTGVPTFGVAKTRFVGVEAGALGAARGSVVNLVDQGEVVGQAVRTRDGVKPVYVSVGHRIGAAQACRVTLELTTGYRQPETTRRADAACRAALQSALGGQRGGGPSGAPRGSRGGAADGALGGAADGALGVGSENGGPGHSAGSPG